MWQCRYDSQKYENQNMTKEHTRHNFGQTHIDAIQGLEDDDYYTGPITREIAELQIAEHRRMLEKGRIEDKKQLNDLRMQRLETRRTQRRGRLRRAGAAVIAVSVLTGGAIYGLKRGGMYDQYKDATTSAPVEMQTTIDSAFQGLDQNKISISSRISAQTRIKDTLKLLDDSPDIVVSKAQSMRSEHTDEFADVSNYESTLTAIDTASSNSAMYEQLNAYMAQFGINVDAMELDDTVTPASKDMARACVMVFNDLPKDFVDELKLRQITVKPAKSLGDTQATYINNQENSGPGIINLSLQEDDRDSDEVERTIVAHELGHAIEATYPGTFNTDAASEGTEKYQAVSNPVSKVIFDAPKIPSSYALEEGEYAAELFSGVLADYEMSFRGTEEARWFESRLNKSYVKLLTKLDAIRPGLGLLLIGSRVDRLHQ